MSLLSSHDPYAGNLLLARLQPILSREEVAVRLRRLPTMPRAVGDIPRHIRVHEMQKMVEFHVPGFEELKLFESIDLMRRVGYHLRNPSHPATWQTISGETWGAPPAISTAGAIFALGPSGTGKSQAIAHCLAAQPLIIHHASFPMCVGPLDQVLSQSLSAPSSGRTLDLATSCMRAWKTSLNSDRFDHVLAKQKHGNGQQLFDTYCQVAQLAYLGLLHLDDVENLFKIPPLRARRGKKDGDKEDDPATRELRIIEDQCLKNLAYFLNTAKIPLILSGTNDGAATLERRLSNAERLAGYGYHRFLPFSGPDDEDFCKVFLPELGRYQYVKDPIAVDDNLAALIHSLTAGVKRIIVNLWMAAHRVAFDRTSSDTLLAQDFIDASRTYMAPVADAVQALLSKDPKEMSRFEDLLPRNEVCWTSFWSH